MGLTREGGRGGAARVLHVTAAAAADRPFTHLKAATTATSHLKCPGAAPSLVDYGPVCQRDRVHERLRRAHARPIDLPPSNSPLPIPFLRCSFLALHITKKIGTSRSEKSSGKFSCPLSRSAPSLHKLPSLRPSPPLCLSPSPSPSWNPVTLAPLRPRRPTP